MVESTPKTNPAFNASSQPAAGGGEMAFVVDVQSFDMMSREDAQAYADKLGAAIEDLRARGIPVTWLSMSSRNELIPAQQTPPGQSAKVRALDEKIGREFYGTQSWADNADIYTKFWAEHGPRTDEAIYCKYFMNAFAVPEDADGKPGYRQILEGDNSTMVDGKPKPFDKSDDVFQSRPTFAQFLEQRGVTKPIFMGAVSSHCVSETAASAIQKHMDPTICPDLVLSWEGETAGKPVRGIWHLRFQDGAAAASPIDYHTNEIRARLGTITGKEKTDRGISDEGAEAIRNARLEKYVDLARKLPPRQDNDASSFRPATGLERPALQL